MIITCPNCNKKFKIDATLIPEDGRDLIFEMNLGSLNILATLNVQIKQHDNVTSSGIKQIKK